MRSLFGGLVFLFFAQSVYGFRSEYRTNPWMDGTAITLEDKSTLGERQPEILGIPSIVRMNYMGRSFNWEGLSLAGRSLQGWGAPFLFVNSEASLPEIDLQLRNFVDANFDVFQVTSQELRIDPAQTRFSGANRYVTYQRYLIQDDEAYLVEKAFVTFRFKYNRLISFSNDSYGRINIADRPTVSQEEAIQTVVDDSRFNWKRDSFSGRIMLVVEPFDMPGNQVEFRFVHKVTIRQFGGLASWNYSVDAVHGAIDQIASNFHLGGSVVGTFYGRNPASGLVTAPLFEATVKQGDKSELSARDGTFSFDPIGAIVELVSPRAKIRKSKTSSVTASPGADGVAQFGVGNLDEVMSFVHIGRVSQFVRNFIRSAPRQIGIGQEDFLSVPIRVNTKAADESIKSCNAWFDPTERSLNFLEADDQCENSSHFADIIYHEWGHALDDALGGIQDSAFSEAVGDFLASLLTNDSQLAPGFIKNVDNRPIRNIDSVRVFPKDRNRDPHLEALIVSGAWWDVLKMMKAHYGDEIAVQKAGEIFIKHLVSTNSYRQSYQGALVVDDDDGNLENCTPHFCFFNAAFAKRGLASLDSRCTSSTTTRIACAESTIKVGSTTE